MATSNQEIHRLYRLLANGYFPKELPPTFSTKSFAEVISNSSDLASIIGNRWQNSSPYFLRIKPHQRRKLDILCPQSYVRQAALISSNYDEIQTYFSSLQGDCSIPVFSTGGKFNRAVQVDSSNKTYNQKKLNLRSRFPVILKLDIKNYYRSIYTHSIPWAIHGKRIAKRNLRNNSLLGNQLDEAIRFGQDGQTIGIPIGPDTSFVISEILLGRLINKMVLEAKIKPDRIIRYFDDIEYGCETEAETHSILSAFQDSLGENELEINYDKVEILSGLSEIESPWLYQLKDITSEYGKLDSDRLLKLFSFLANLARKYPNDHIFRYFLRKMRTTMVNESAWDTYQSILLSLFQEDKGNTKEIFEQFGYYREIGWELNKAAIKEALDRKILNQLSTSISSELSWAVYGYSLFNIKVDKTLVEKILLSGDGPSKVLISKIAFDRGISIKKMFNELVRNFDENILNSSDWLFGYEVLINKWHNKYTSVRIANNPELFELIRDENISFLNSTIMLDQDLPTVFQRFKTSQQGFDSDDEWEDESKDPESKEYHEGAESDLDENLSESKTDYSESKIPPKPLPFFL